MSQTRSISKLFGNKCSVFGNKSMYLAIDINGADNLYVSDTSNHRIHKVTPQRTVLTIT